MLRKLMAVVVGYIVMAGLVMVAFTVTATVLGVEGVYKPGLYEPSTTWLLMSIVAGIVAAIAGGFFCRAIGRSRQLVHAFAGVVLVLGLVTALFAILGPKDYGLREPGESIAEAAAKTKQPIWISLLNPLIGAGGVILGGGLKRDPEPPPSA